MNQYVRQRNYVILTFEKVVKLSLVRKINHF